MERVMYNTVLGAKPLMADGRTFYYSDYNFNGTKFYRDNQHWSCCSGTLPQVAADYRINTYFRDPEGVWVNLYIPSTLRWKQNGAEVVLQQASQYPYESGVQFDVQTSRAREFTLNFRIPAWAAGASISINGHRVQSEVIPGSFAAIHRQWNTGDHIELELPMTTRLEPIDPQHPETVALLHGPLVLFAITEKQPSLTRSNLLAAERKGERIWQVATTGEPLKMLPFVEIADEPYSTYLRVT
jgi:hypothetical protein